MQTTTSLPTQQRIDELSMELSPDVVRIRLNVHPDWSDHPALHFKVILSDDASRRDRLAGVTDRVTSKLPNELGLESSDYISYFRFRSQSEQASLREDSWE